MGKIGPKFSNLLTVRAAGADVVWYYGTALNIDHHIKPKNKIYHPYSISQMGIGSYLGDWNCLKLARLLTFCQHKISHYKIATARWFDELCGERECRVQTEGEVQQRTQVHPVRQRHGYHASFHREVQFSIFAQRHVVITFARTHCDNRSFGHVSTIRAPVGANNMSLLRKKFWKPWWFKMHLFHFHSPHHCIVATTQPPNNQS